MSATIGGPQIWLAAQQQSAKLYSVVSGRGNAHSSHLPRITHNGTPQCWIGSSTEINLTGKESLPGSGYSTNGGRSMLTAQASESGSNINVDGGDSTRVDENNKVIVPDDDYAYLRKNDTTLILSTTDTGVLLNHNFDFETSTCLIYAEKVILQGNISLPGKNLGIFCNSLTVVPRQAVIDLSGAKGQSGITTTNQPGPPTSVSNGGNGGAFWLWVDTMSQSLAQSIRVVTTGGDGGVGNSTSGAFEGANGGNGGNGGTATFMFGSTSTDLVNQISDPRSSAAPPPWPKMAKQGLQTAANCATLDWGGVPTSKQTALTNICTLYGNYAAAYTSLKDQIYDLLNPYDLKAPDAPDAVAKAASSLSTKITSLLSSTNAPKLVQQSDIDAVSAVTTAIHNWIATYSTKSESSTADQKLATTIDSLVLPAVSSSSALTSAVNGTIMALAGVNFNATSYVEQYMGLVTQGRAGAGGQGGSAGLGPGSRGNDGLAGRVIAFNLTYVDGISDDMDCPMAFAFPEECRMLLNKADSYYFSSDISQWFNAAIFYQRLTRRLAFVPAYLNELQAANNKGGSSTAPSALRQAYEDFAPNVAAKVLLGALTFDGLTQLQSVYNTAQTRISQLMLNQDMFGHSPTWVPRLSLQYYQAKVATMLPQLTGIETEYNTYSNAKTSQDDLATAVTNGLSAVQSTASQAQAMSDYLTDTQSGPMAKSAYQIAAYTPKLEQKRVEIKGEIATIQADIQASLNLSPQMLIDAMSTLAFAPTGFNFAVQLGAQGYKAFTTTQDSSGNNVNKDYVVKQIGTCGSTLDSLSEAYSQSDNGPIAVDDPGAMKIMSTEADIESLLDEYKSAIRSADAAAIKQSLDDYIDLIKLRNTAVIEYNACLTLLASARSDLAYSNARAQSLGQANLTIDPNLPAISHWLSKARDDMRFNVLKHLNYENRAIQYWGLVGPAQYGDPGPLRDSTALQTYQTALSGAFERALEIYGGNVWSTFPANPATQQGTFYKLSASELRKFLRPTTQGADTVYSVSIKFDPTGSTTFPGLSNVRLSQARFWLIGAKGSGLPSQTRLLAHLIHSGQETMVDNDGNKYSFLHDSVDIKFVYAPLAVKSESDCVSSNVWALENISLDYPSGGDGTVGTNTFASIGPFTMWTLAIKVSENPVLAGSPAAVDLSGVTEGWVEFYGGFI